MARYPYQYPFKDEGEPRQPRVDWAILFLLILLIAAVIFIAPKAFNIPSGSQTAPGEISGSVNPELSAFRRYEAAGELRQGSHFAVQNPELFAVRRYQVAAELRQASQFAGQNPEIFTAQRYLNDLAKRQESTFLAQNPEVGLYQRYLAEQR